MRNRLFLILSLLGSCLMQTDSAWAQEVGEKVSKAADIEFAKPDGVPLLLDLHFPEGVKDAPLVMFIHGGGWKSGNRSRCRLAWLVEHGYAVASIEYRLSKEAVFPAQIEDCKGAVRWLRANEAKYPYSAEKIVVAGTSAGGHLAALMGASNGVEELEGDTGGNAEESSAVQGTLDYYGPTDFLLRSKKHPDKTEKPSGSVFQLLGGKASEKQDLAKLASPITHLDEKDPPFLILHGDEDTTVQLILSEVFHQRAKELDLDTTLHIEKGAKHGWKMPTEAEREAVLGLLKKVFGEARK